MQFSERRPRIMTIDEVAKYLRLHKSTIYRMVRDSQIPASKIGNQWRFRKDIIDSWLSNKEISDISNDNGRKE
jgi:excisionase family DNA binding protein